MTKRISEMKSGEEIKFYKPKSYEFIKPLKSAEPEKRY